MFGDKGISHFQSLPKGSKKSALPPTEGAKDLMAECTAMFMPNICPVDPLGAALVRADVRMLWIRLIEQVRGRSSNRKSSKPRTIV